MIVWSCPYWPMQQASTRFDDLRGHVRAIHFRGQPLQPTKASLEHLDWREEERRKGHDDDPKERTRTRREEKRPSSPQKTSPRKAARWENPAARSLGSLGESPGVLLSLLPTSPVKKGKGKSPRKPRPTEPPRKQCRSPGRSLHQPPRALLPGQLQGLLGLI